MIRLILILTIVFLVSSSFAQERLLNISQISIYDEYNKYISDRNIQISSKVSNISSNIDMGLFSIGLQRIKNNFIREISIMPLHFSTSNYETVYKDTSYSQIIAGGQQLKYRFFTDYKYSYILRDKSKKNLPFVGIGSMFYYQFESYNPRISNMFPRKINYFELNMFANIGFMQKITKDIYLIMQIPVILYNVNMSIDNISNPTLPEALRTSTTFDNSFLPKRYLLMIGLNYKIKKN